MNDGIISKIVSKLHILIMLGTGFGLYNAHMDFQANIKVKEDEIPVIKNKIKRKQRDLKDVEKYKQNIKEAKDQIQLVAKQIEKIQQQLPSSGSDIEIFEILKSLSKDLNIQGVNVSSSGSEVAKDFYFVKSYQFQGTGTFLQFLIFIEKIKSLNRILNIQTFNFSKSTDIKQRGRFELIRGEILIDAYRYNEGYKEETGIESIEREFK